MQDVLRALEKISTSMVSDTLNLLGVKESIISASIRQLVPGARIIGPAFTVATRPGTVDPCLLALENISEGEVLVIDTGGDRTFAYLGEQMATDARNAGAVGIVIDGLVRDIEGLVEMGLPVYARGVTPRVAFYQHYPGEHGAPITCGGCVVSPGDIIYGDANGLVVIAKANIERVAEIAEELERVDEERLVGVREGKRISEFPSIPELHQRLRAGHSQY